MTASIFYRKKKGKRDNMDISAKLTQAGRFY